MLKVKEEVRGEADPDNIKPRGGRASLCQALTWTPAYKDSYNDFVGWTSLFPFYLNDVLMGTELSLKLDQHQSPRSEPHCMGHFVTYPLAVCSLLH